MIMNASQCPLCGGDNNCQQCSVGSYKGPCWCEGADIPEALLALVPSDQRNTACICRECVTAFHRQQVGTVSKTVFRMESKIPFNRPPDTLSPSNGERDGVRGFSKINSGKQHTPQASAIQPGDVYFDRGLMVFTAAFHLRRGYCCANGCRHCPYPVTT